MVGCLAAAAGLPVLAMLALAAFLRLLNPVVLGAPNPTMSAIVSGGERREYLLHVPKTYDGSKPAPLVVSLHGAALLPATQMQISRWNDLADRHGFLVVYPSGIRIAPLPLFPPLPVWLMRSRERRASEARFISDLVESLSRTYAVDSTRIYVSGFSNGGGMAFALSCTLAHRIAAVGTVAAARELPWSACGDPEPVPLIAFHGTADRFVSYDGAPSGAAAWARRNGCGPDPVETTVSEGVARTAYTNCARNADVVLFTLQGGGHAWPGGGPMPRWLVGRTSRGVDATAEMWAFFRQHRLREEQ